MKPIAILHRKGKPPVLPGKMLTGKSVSVTWTMLLCLGSGFAGYWVHEQRTDGALISRAGTLPQLEYLAAPDSFSRVENTRKQLEALCIRMRLEIQNRMVAAENAVRKRTARAEGAEGHWEGAIPQIESALREFQGTEQELYIAQDLLLALKMAKRFDRWTDVYLQALYKHPTHPVVSRFASEAVAISRLAGRAQDVVTALQHVDAIPLDFDDKYRIRVALGEATPGMEAPHNDKAAAK